MTTTVQHTFVSRKCATCSGCGATSADWGRRIVEHVCLDCDGTGRQSVRLDRLTTTELDALHHEVWAEQMERQHRSTS